MAIQAIEAYEFGPYRFDAGERLLYRGDELVSLPPKVAGTLLVLIRNAGRMVDKNDLMKAVWPDTFVEDGALTRNISLLRKTFGDTGDVATFIETIPKRGYKFLAPVRATAGQAVAVKVTEEIEVQPVSFKPSVRWKKVASILALGVIAAIAVVTRFAIHNGSIPVAPPAAAEKALAVLPFRSLDKDASQDYFAEGMTQAMITGLAKLHRTRVVSLASIATGQRDADAWNALLRDDSVKRVLTGTILRSGSRVRIDAQLMDPRTRSVYWANSYERNLDDVLTLESAVAEAIAGEIQVSLTEQDRERLRQRTVNPGALDAYLRGRYFWNRRTEESLKRAIQYFQQAIAADPNYALAYSGLADSYALLGSVGTDGMAPKQAMPLAKAAAQKAIEIEPALADGHVSLAYVLLSYDWDLPGAQREFARALELDPNSATAHHWYSHYFLAAGDLTKATEQMHAAVQLEPLSPVINIGVGWCLYYSQKYEQAIQQYRAVAEMDPGYPLAHQTLGMAYQQEGRFDEAIEEFKRTAAFSGNSPASVAALASAYAAAGRPAEAQQELARLEAMSHSRYVPALYFASVNHSLGDTAKTFAWGWKAIGERCDYLIYLRVEPQVGKLAGNPEFLRAMAALHQ